MRTLRLCAFALVLAGCTVDPADPRGRACDDTHPCREDRVCVAGVCVAAGAGAADGGGCEGDALIGTACVVGDGECRNTGQYICEAGSAQCDAEPKAQSTELCDALDNDCNGVADDNVAPPVCGRQTGVCSGATNTRACQPDGGFNDCDYGPDFETDETRCDGLDNDCDGVVDDVSLCLYTIAGSGPPNLVDGPPSIARFAMPRFLTPSPSGGDLYVVDGDNHTIRKVPMDGGAVTTVAGTGRCGFLDGPATSAQFCEPTEVVFAPNGDFFISDTGNNRIRKHSGGTISTVAGRGLRGSINGAALSATFSSPVGLFLLPDQDLLIADRDGHRIRRFSAATGQVTTEAGSTQGDTDGTRSTMQFDQPVDMVMDSAGMLYVTEASGDRVRLVPRTGNSSVLAGSPAGDDGYVEGAGIAAQFADPTQIVIDEPRGLLFVSDMYNAKVRSITLDGGVTAPVVGGRLGGFANGTSSTAGMERVPGFANIGSDWILSDGNSVLRRALGPPDRAWPNTTLEDFAGTPATERSRDGAQFSANLYRPFALAVSADGNIYFTDFWGDMLRQLSPDGTVTTLVGEPVLRPSGNMNGPFGSARLRDPRGLAFGPDGRLYIAEGISDAIRAVDFATRTVSRVAGSDTGLAGHVNGTLSASRFNNVRAVRWAKDLANRDVLYANDFRNRLIRKVDVEADAVTDFAGTLNTVWYGTPVDGARGVGRFSTDVGGLDVDAANNLWIADNNRVRKVDPQGVLSSPFPAAPGRLFDVSVQGDSVFAVGQGLILEYQISTLSEVRRLVTRDGWRDGVLGSTVTTSSPGSYTFLGVKALPDFILLADEQGGRIRRMWR